jgi:hypothetical protein
MTYERRALLPEDTRGRDHKGTEARVVFGLLLLLGILFGRAESSAALAVEVALVDGPR